MILKHLNAAESLKKRLAYINAKYGLQISEASLPLDDNATLELFREGNTEGIFQFGVSGMRAYLRALRPAGLQDIEILYCLYTTPCLAKQIPVWIQYKSLGLPFYFDETAISANRRAFIALHTVIAWKQAYLKAHFGVDD